MNEILQLIEKTRNLPMDHEPNVSDLWDMINAIEKIAEDELNNPVPHPLHKYYRQWRPWQREGKDE